MGVARRALASRQLRRVLLAFVVFNTAEWAVWVALLVRAYGHGGVRASAVMGVVQLAPAVVVAPFASVLGDRWPRTRALTTGYVLQALTLLVTAATLAAGAPFAVVAAAAAVMTCTVTLTRPVRYSLGRRPPPRRRPRPPHRRLTGSRRRRRPLEIAVLTPEVTSARPTTAHLAWRR